MCWHKYMEKKLPADGEDLIICRSTCTRKKQSLVARVAEGCVKHTYNTRPFENGSAGRREEGLASLTPCTKNEKNEVKSPFPIAERGAGKSALGRWGGNYPLMAKIYSFADAHMHNTPFKIRQKKGLRHR